MCPELLQRALRTSGAPPVELRETHGSWVFLTPTHAFKLKKPLRFDFADLRAPSARRAACEEEVRANQALAAGLAYELRGVVPTPDGYVLHAADHPSAVDAVVVTRRFDETSTLAVRIDDGRCHARDLARVGAVLAGFHAGARRVPGPHRIRESVAHNLDGLEEVAVADHEVAALRRFTSAFLDCWDGVLAGRAAAGRQIDGHGDLRAEHVLLEGDHVLVIDRLDLPELREVDVVDDLAFLCMDLEARGAPELVLPLLSGYLDAGGERPPRELLAFFAVHRAAVRAKVAFVRAGQPGAPSGCRSDAAHLLALASRFAARARGENVLVVSGPPAVGKSTVAAALGAATGLPVLRSDELRTELTDGYDRASRTAVYAELGRRAGAVPGCIVDATFGEPAFRRAFLAELDRDHRRRVFAVECRATPATLRRRAGDRRRGAAFGSQADLAVASRLAATFTPFDELDPADRLALECEGGSEEATDTVLTWMDAHLAAGRLL